MSDDITTEEAKELPKLTVEQFLKDLASFPQDSEIFASVIGSNITMPIVQAISIDSKEGKKLTVLLVPYDFARQSLEYADKFIAAQSQITEGEVVN